MTPEIEQEITALKQRISVLENQQIGLDTNPNFTNIMNNYLYSINRRKVTAGTAFPTIKPTDVIGDLYIRGNTLPTPTVVTMFFFTGTAWYQMF